MDGSFKGKSLRGKDTNSDLTNEAEDQKTTEQQIQDPDKKNITEPSSSAGIQSINSFLAQVPFTPPRPTENPSAAPNWSSAGRPSYTDSSPPQDQIAFAASTPRAVNHPGSFRAPSASSEVMSRTSRSKAPGPQAAGSEAPGDYDDLAASLEVVIRDLPTIGQNLAAVFAGIRDVLENSGTTLPAAVPAATNAQPEKIQPTSLKRSRTGEDRVLGGKIPSPNLDQSTLYGIYRSSPPLLVDHKTRLTPVDKAPPRRDLDGTMRIPNKWGWCAANCQRKKTERLGCSALRDGSSGPECERWVHAHELCSGCPAGNYSSKKPEAKWSCEMFGYTHRFSPSERGREEQDFNNGRTGPPSANLLNAMRSAALGGGLLPPRKKQKTRAPAQEQEQDDEEDEGEQEGDGVGEDEAAPTAQPATAPATKPSDQTSAEDEHGSVAEDPPAVALCGSPMCQIRDVPLASNDAEDVDLDLVGTRCYAERQGSQCLNLAHDNAVCVGGYNVPGSLAWFCANTGLACRFANQPPYVRRTADRHNRRARGEPDLVAVAAAESAARGRPGDPDAEVTDTDADAASSLLQAADAEVAREMG